MQRFYSILYLLFAVNIALSQSINVNNNITNSKTYAIIIGISGYENKSLPQLKYADKDALVFSEWLKSNAGGNVPDAQIRILLNKDATIAAILNALDWVKAQTTTNDLVYFYFSGHGDVETENTFSLGYLLAYNTPANNYRNNAIKIETLNDDANFLSTKKQAKVVLITDACHSGKLAGDFFKGKQLVGKQLQQVLNNEVRLTSCAVDEEAAEGPDWGGGRGVFSYYLVNGLNGLADNVADGSIKLNELKQFLDSAFVADKILRLQNHKQHPVIDGNPNFPMVVLDSATVAAYKRKAIVIDTSMITTATGLSMFKKASIQPIDYFFTEITTLPIENLINTLTLQNKDSIALNITNQIIVNHDTLTKYRKYYFGKDSLQRRNESPVGYYEAMRNTNKLDSFNLLKNQLSKNKSLSKRFIEKFVELIHNRIQEMINAYISGDIAELEKRQYYYSGDRNYDDFLSLINLSLQLIPEDHHLANVLRINATYLAGLMARLNMATMQNTDSLLKVAMSFQQKTLLADPYAGYLHNELGNLFVHQKKYDSANYHFNFASVLAPTWAIPWSNKIRMNLMQKKYATAKEALHKADSLQPNMAFVFMNGGLLMEKEKNWLSAESYFLKAIEQNKVHYLPYEHLGNIYLQTGRYALSDEYYSKAAERKENFAINDAYFRFGVEMGGVSGINEDSAKIWLDCYDNLTKDTVRLKPFVKFFEGNSLMATTSEKKDQAANFLKEFLQAFPKMYIAHHILGKMYYTDGKWKEAEEALNLATANYKDDLTARTMFKDMIKGTAVIDDDSCLLNYLTSFQYNELEDHYMLANIYERKGELNKAIAKYNEISSIENKQQIVQANYTNYKSIKTLNKNTEEFGNVYERALATFEIPLKMAGAIKAARLYEQLGQYEQAEEILLKQVLANRAAGDLRRKAMNENKPGTYELLGKINFYWLGVNQNLEAETYNFYKRMITAFPRNFYWKEKAGWFLYKRLQLAYKQMSIEKYTSFTKSLSDFEYPFTSSQSPPDENPIKFNLPVTKEEIIIPKYIYNPTKEALNFFLQSIQLNGALEPSADITQAIAALYAWQGSFDTASVWYIKAVKQQPEDSLLRNILVDVLAINNDFVTAQEQLDTLYLKQKISRDKILNLINYDMLSNKFQKVDSTLKKFEAIDEIENCKLTTLRATNAWLQGKMKEALKYLKTFPDLKIDKEMLFDVEKFKNDATINNFYSLARIYAQQKQHANAITFLNRALDEGFKYDQVLQNDAVWNFIDTKKWNAIFEKYQLGIGYSNTETFISAISYRIPDEGEGYKE